ncbi:hypothetical protein F7725_017507 [Dissostichus mawsoni]|uniref:Uncharacterized protein n=1 Tax=Dissostichus mawsoni TaxID=36200 RepID=A0A7J5Z4P9_DISMA|nr:hypothetical protein F7725_017507 [Dissostichus mawsoni]
MCSLVCWIKEFSLLDKGIDLCTFYSSCSSTPHSPYYKRLNSSVPVLKLYFGDGCLLKDFRISRDSLEALMRCLGPERRQAWGHHMTVLTTVYWLAHGLSYSVVSQAFQVPLSTVHRLVHQGVEDIAALRHTVIRLPAGPELEEVGQGFQQLANSPAFSSCVGGQGRRDRPVDQISAPDHNPFQLHDHDYC